MYIIKKCTLENVSIEWEKFITTGKYNVCNVRPQIAASWLRSIQAGVRPLETISHTSLDLQTLTSVQKEKARLIKIAKPFMEHLYQFVKGSDFVVILADEHGYILEMFGDQTTWQKPPNGIFSLGTGWREEDAGTNAIGTALVIEEPIQISGAEHFCKAHHRLTCSSAPIFDCDGKLIGILNMSGASEASHTHTLGIVVAAAEAIIAQLRIQQKEHELDVAHKRLTSFFNTVSDGVLIVDKNEVVTTLNPAAKMMLGTLAREVLGTKVNRVLTRRDDPQKNLLSIEAFHDVEVIMDTKDGARYFAASGEPMANEDGEVAGGVIVLHPLTRVQNRVNHASGHFAALHFSDIIGDSVEIREVIHIATLAANTHSHTLLQGESGTGKEIFAQAIHNGSTQHAGPFVAVNCGAIPRELIGSELFGYEEGAFTGAKRGGKPGKFELAAGGTLFLDEIGDMPHEQQVALLRVIQEKTVSRIGSDRTLPVNVRLICATNKNLAQEVERGSFRQDLFYRLNVIPITIPPLRCRSLDIPLLFTHFLDKLGHEKGCKLFVEPEVIDCLKQYHWPGNIRELQNVAERMASLALNGIITISQLPKEILTPLSFALSPSLPQAVSDFKSREHRKDLSRSAERTRIVDLLNQHAGNVSRVAREMGVSRKTLYNKMRNYAIQN